MKVGIVGSRRRHTLRDRKIVFGIVERLVQENPGVEITVVSGGCPKGADAFAEEAARALRLPMTIFPVQKHPPIHDKEEFRRRAFARNRLIAEASDVIYALVAPDRTGGTENTIRHGKELQKKIFRVDGDGTTYLE